VKCGRILKISSTVATLAAENANEVIVVPMVGSCGVYLWRESGVYSQEMFLLVRLAGIWLQSQ
jgi:hypothetical protein